MPPRTFWDSPEQVMLVGFFYIESVSSHAQVGNKQGYMRQIDSQHGSAGEGVGKAGLTGPEAIQSRKMSWNPEWLFTNLFTVNSQNGF